jgi:ribosome biogenesis SPOUT family RNA methylase Rps3
MTDRALAPLKEIPYLDHPELKFNEHESTEMPFRYVKSEEGEPIMPDVSDLIPSLTMLSTDQTIQGMVDLIRKDSDKAIDDMF